MGFGSDRKASLNNFVALLPLGATTNYKFQLDTSFPSLFTFANDVDFGGSFGYI